MKMTEHFKNLVFGILRESAEKYVEKGKTDIAVDVETILLEDFNLTDNFYGVVSWYGTTNGTYLARNNKERELFADNFKDKVKVMVDINFTNESVVIRDFVNNCGYVHCIEKERV